MVTCRNCDSAVPEGAMTCPHCGIELSGGSSGGRTETAPGDGDGNGGEYGSPDTDGSREISSEEAESGTTRIYGLAGSDEVVGGPPPEVEAAEASTVEGTTTKVTGDSETAAVGPEARDPPRGSRPSTREPTDDSDGTNRRRILGGVGLFALGAGGLYAFLARSGGDGDGSDDGQDTADGDGTGEPSDGEADTDRTGSDGSDGSSEPDVSDSGQVSDGDDQVVDDVRTIEMGILMGISGGLDTLGPPIRDGAELVARQINEGKTDISVDARFEDTATDPEQGIRGAEELIEAGYPMICGALASEVSIKVAISAAIPEEVPMISPASTAPQYSALEGDFTFRTPVLDSIQGQVMADVASQRLGAATAAILAQDDSYGGQLSAAFAESFENAGGRVTDEVIFTPGQSSYVAQLETAMYSDPDLLVVVSFPADGVQILRDFYDRFDRGEMPILVSDGLRDETIPDNVGHDMTNVTGTYPLQEGPGLAFFRDLYEQTYGVDPTTKIFTQQAYDAAATLVLAQAAAGEKDGAAIRDQIRPVTDPGGTEIGPENLVEGVERAVAGEEIEYRGASGEIQYDDRGDQSAATFAYFGFDEYGDIRRIDTVEQ